MKLKQFLTTGAAAFMLLGCAACGGGTEADVPAPKPEPKPASTHTYAVYDGNGALKYETDNIFAAYIRAGKSSTRSNRYTVYKGEENIFTFSTGKYYKLLGSKFAGTIDASDQDKAIKEARAWARQNPDSYVIDNTGTEYVALGRALMENSAMNDDSFGLEYFSGSYVYAYSKRPDSDASFKGVSYMEFTLDMTKMLFRYHASESETHWNAYIFCNFFTTSPWGCCDIGLISSSGGMIGAWTPVFNYNGTMVTASTEPITMMEYDEVTGYWKGKDVIKFRAFATRNAYCMEFNNLTTGVKRAFSQSDERVGSLQVKADKAFTLLAASYCPVMTKTSLWDARSGAVFKGLKFRNPKVAAFKEGATKADDYNDVEKADFLPSNTEVFAYGFAQGGDNANYVVGEDEEGKFIETNISYTEEF